MKSDFRSNAQDEAWIDAELMIKGLEGRRSSEPTHPSTITALRNITNWIFQRPPAFTIDFKTIFGHVPRRNNVCNREGREERVCPPRHGTRVWELPARDLHELVL